MNLEKEISQTVDASDSVFKNTLIWVLSMIPSLVSSVWTSMSSLKDQEAESDLEEDARPELEQNIKSAKNKLCNGSGKNMMVPSITDYLKIHYLTISSLLLYS